MSDSLIAVSDWDDVEILRWDDFPSLSLAGYKNTGGRVMAVNMTGDIIYSAEWISFRIFQFGPIDGPDLDVSDRHVEIPFTEVGECRETSLTLTNSGVETLVIEDVVIGHPDYEISVSNGEIPHGEMAEGIITYCASSGNGHTSFRIVSNDPDEPEVGVGLEGNSPWGLDVGQEAPDFTLPSVNDYGEITLSELQGRVVVIAFFASW